MQYLHVFKKREKDPRKREERKTKFETKHTFKMAVFCGLFSGLKIFFTEKHS